MRRVGIGFGTAARGSMPDLLLCILLLADVFALREFVEARAARAGCEHSPRRAWGRPTTIECQATKFPKYQSVLQIRLKISPKRLSLRLKRKNRELGSDSV
jgi:hypothetical protein